MNTNRLEELRLRFKKEPLGKAMGAELISLDEGYAYIKVPIRPDFLIVDNIVQGGIITTVADFAGVYAAMSVIPEGHTPAVNITIDFMRPVAEGRIIAVAGVSQQTRSSIWADIDITSFDIGGGARLVAHARIHFAKPKLKQVENV